jgi:hypothetical protein
MVGGSPHHWILSWGKKAAHHTAGYSPEERKLVTLTLNIHLRKEGCSPHRWILTWGRKAGNLNIEYSPEEGRLLTTPLDTHLRRNWWRLTWEKGWSPYYWRLTWGRQAGHLEVKASVHKWAVLWAHKLQEQLVGGSWYSSIIILIK